MRPMPFDAPIPMVAISLAPFNNPGGPVELNPQPLPPRIYFTGFNPLYLSGVPNGKARLY